jgi:hypothetical protein
MCYNPFAFFVYALVIGSNHLIFSTGILYGG